MELGWGRRQRETRRAAGGFEFKSSKGLNSGRWVHLCEASCRHPELTFHTPSQFSCFPSACLGLGPRLLTDFGNSLMPCLLPGQKAP